jgi:hypothetical protein
MELRKIKKLPEKCLKLMEIECNGLCQIALLSCYCDNLTCSTIIIIITIVVVVLNPKNTLISTAAAVAAEKRERERE